MSTRMSWTGPWKRQDDATSAGRAVALVEHGHEVRGLISGQHGRNSLLGLSHERRVEAVVIHVGAEVAEEDRLIR